MDRGIQTLGTRFALAGTGGQGPSLAVGPPVLPHPAPLPRSGVHARGASIYVGDLTIRVYKTGGRLGSRWNLILPEAVLRGAEPSERHLDRVRAEPAPALDRIASRRLLWRMGAPIADRVRIAMAFGGVAVTEVGASKPVVFTLHARGRMRERGATEEHVAEAIWVGQRELVQRGLFLYRLNLVLSGTGTDGTTVSTPLRPTN